jgi:CspA family cold shock protein
MEIFTKTFNLLFKKNTMKTTGTVKWFNPDKGYGFIAPDDGTKDVFIHISALNAATLNTLDENQKIKFEVTSSQGKESATNIELI